MKWVMTLLALLFLASTAAAASTNGMTGTWELEGWVYDNPWGAGFNYHFSQARIQIGYDNPADRFAGWSAEDWRVLDAVLGSMDTGEVPAELAEGALPEPYWSVLENSIYGTIYETELPDGEKLTFTTDQDGEWHDLVLDLYTGEPTDYNQLIWLTLDFNPARNQAELGGMVWDRSPGQDDVEFYIGGMARKVSQP